MSGQERQNIQLDIAGVTRRYGSFAALSNVSIGVRQGEFLTLLGPSGSGKSTLLNILAGFDAPTEGQLTQGGKDVTHRPAEERNFGMVFQGYGRLIPSRASAVSQLVKKEPVGPVAAFSP